MGRQIIGGFFQSLDGVTQSPGNPHEDATKGFELGGWLAPLFHEGLGNQVSSLLSAPYDLLLGRRTYEIFAGHWPYQSDANPIAASINRARKFVLSRSGITNDWAGTQRLESLEDVATLKQTEGPKLVIQGSTTLYSALLGRGLIDRLVVMTAPVLLGRGKRMFDDATPARTLELVEQRVTSNGLVMSTYDVRGEVETSLFESEQEPSDVEIARRERFAREDAASR